LDFPKLTLVTAVLVVQAWPCPQLHGRIFASSILKKKEKGEFHVAFLCRLRKKLLPVDW
jgi:hypothetical protein